MTLDERVAGLERKVKAFLYGSTFPCLNLKRRDIAEERAFGTLQFTIENRHVGLIESVMNEQQEVIRELKKLFKQKDRDYQALSKFYEDLRIELGIEGDASKELFTTITNMTEENARLVKQRDAAIEALEKARGVTLLPQQGQNPRPDSRQ